MIAAFFIIFAFLYRGIRGRKRHLEYNIDDRTNYLTTNTSFPPLSQQHQHNLQQQIQQSQHHQLHSVLEQQQNLSSSSSFNNNNQTYTSTTTVSTGSSSSEKIFSRSDSTITTASVDPALSSKRRGDSIASTISTSGCSEILQPDGRRSSEGTRLVGHRRSSGRIRRYGTRISSVGGRRRTTGR